ncbi:hypothetical protein [Salinarchaeum laminariae]|uniref:hypothetical protein n=1 Tax=Salinarchaeum laminariae TaxID=869888 RepID=UPI0020C0A82B|nr:hypothetical protein [Salinarchaeum laminariae]
MARRPDSNGGDTGDPTTSEEQTAGGAGEDTERKDDPTEPDIEESTLIDRRNAMKLLGGTAAAVVGLGATATAGAAESYELIEVGEDEAYTVSLGSGDTLENVLIDVSANRADVHIGADGDGWEIRNVAIRGAIDIGDDSPGGDTAEQEGGYNSVFTCDASAGGTGLIENVYLGDGLAPGVDKSALVTATNHEGHIDVRNFNCGGFSTTCFYVSGFGREGTGGSMTIENSYFENSSSAHIRPAGNVTIRNCVVTNTNEVVYLPRTFGGVEQAVTSRGIWTSYSGSTTLVENCDIDIREENTCEAPWDYSGPCQANAVWASEAGIDLVDCEVRGTVGGNVNESGTGSNPDLSLPSGCPADPKSAANGTAGDGSGDSGSGGSGNLDSGSDGSVITITGGSGSNVVTYAFEVSDTVELGADANDEDTVSGSTATGKLAGGSDSFRFTETVTDFAADGDVTVSIDGQAVDPNELASDGSYRTDDGEETSEEEEPVLSRSITLSGGSQEETVEYTFSVSEAVAKGERANSEESVSDTTASGYLIGGTDSFEFAGEITSFDATADLTVTVDGEAVDQAALGDDSEDSSGTEEPLPNGLSITGGSIDSPTEYAFSVSDALAEGANANSEDTVSGTDADGLVVGGTDDYEFAGEVTSFSTTGDPTVTVNGSTVDPAELGDGSGDSTDDGPDLSRRLTVSGGSASNTVEYTVTVTEAIAKGDRANSEESVSGTTGHGYVIGGTDSFEFAGEITSFDASDTVSLTVDGQTVDPADYDSEPDDGTDDAPDHSRSLTVSGGSASNTVEYSVTVSEAVAKGDRANSEESISGTTASGYVVGGTDSFEFAGEVTSFTASGDVSLTIDGESVDPSSFGDGSSDDSTDEDTAPELTNSIRLSGGSIDSPVEYSFTVSEAVAKGDRANSEESVSGTTASGYVVGGTDSFEFAGEITSFESSGDLSVTVNGSSVDL